MGKSYSPSRGGFYDDELHGDAVPADAIPVTDVEWRALLKANHTQGKAIEIVDGKPTAVEKPPPSREKSLIFVRARRDVLLKESDWSQFPDAPLSEDQRKAWVDYRQKLRDLPKADDPLAFPSAPT